MAKYLSGRVKRVSQDKLSDDRYKYLEVEQTEPNLGDPSSTVPSLPAGTQYQLISVINSPGERYWIPVGGGLIPGSITVYDENILVGGISSTTQLNFTGAAITATSNSIKETVLTLRDSLTHSFALNERVTQDNNTAIGFVKFATNAAGIVTLTNVTGSFDVYPSTNSENGQLFVDGSGIGKTPTSKQTSNISNVLSNIEVTPEFVSSNKELLFNNSGEFKGASNLIYDDANSRVGINSAEPGYGLDVRGTIRATNYIGAIEEANKLSTPRTFSIDGHDANSILRETVTKTVNFNQTTSTIAINTTGISIGDYIIPINSVIDIGTRVDTIGNSLINLNKNTINPSSENNRDLVFSVAHQAGEVTAIGKTFDGQGNVVLVGKLKDIDGLTAGEYGTSTQVPVLNVNSQGIVTSISNQSINFTSATVENALKIETQNSSTNSLHHITFVSDDNTSSGQYENVRTDSELVFNPSTNAIGIATNNPLQRFQIGASFYDSKVTKSGITENSGVTQVGINTDNLEVNYIILPITDKIDEGTFIQSIQAAQITLNQQTAGALDNDSLEFVTVNNTDVFTVDADGKVGIGTTEPKEKLDVYGDAKINGLTTTTTLTVTGDAQFYSDVKIGTGITISSGVITATDFVGIASSSKTTRVEVYNNLTGTNYQTSRFLFIKNGVTHNSFTTPFTETASNAPYYNTQTDTIHANLQFITSRNFNIDGLDNSSIISEVATQSATTIGPETNTIAITTTGILQNHYVHPISGIISLGTKISSINADEIVLDRNTLNSTGQNNIDLSFGNVFGAGEVTSPQVAYNNSSDVTFVGKLKDIDGLTAGEYGTSTQVPVLNVNSQGIVTSISNQSINLNITTVNQANTVKAQTSQQNTIQHLTFVENDNNNSTTYESIYTDPELVFKPNTNTIGIATNNPLQRFQVGPSTLDVQTNKVNVTINATTSTIGLTTNNLEVGQTIIPISNVIAENTVINSISSLNGGEITLNQNTINSTQQTGQQLSFADTNNSSVFTIASDGKVGIGTTEPKRKLDIFGNAHIEGDLEVTGSITGSINLASNLNLGANTTNELVLQTGNNTTSTLDNGSTAGYLLKTNANAVAPSWVDPSTLSVSSATDATNADKVAITAKTDNVDYWVHFGSATSGDDDVNIGNGNGKELKFNPSTGTLTATTFSGLYSGNATTASNLNLGANTTNELVLQTGNSSTSTLDNGSTAGYLLKTNAGTSAPTWVDPSTLTIGSATNATNATNVAITTKTDDVDYWVHFGSATSGNDDVNVGNGNGKELKFNPSTGTLTATTFIGAYSGNATTASNLNLGANTTNELVLQTGNTTTSTLDNGSNAGYLLKTNAGTSAPTWVDPSTLTIGTASDADEVKVKGKDGSVSNNRDYYLIFNRGENSSAGAYETLYHDDYLSCNIDKKRFGINVGRTHDNTSDFLDGNLGSRHKFNTSGRLHINEIKFKSGWVTRTGASVTSGQNIIDLSTDNSGVTGIEVGMYVRPIFYENNYYINPDTKVTAVNNTTKKITLSQNIAYTSTSGVGVDLIIGYPDYEDVVLVTDSGNVAISTSPFGNSGDGLESFNLKIGNHVRIGGNLDVIGTLNATVNGSSSSSGSSDEVKTIQKTNDTATFLTFVADNNTSSTTESVHTHPKLLFDSINEKLGISTTVVPSYVNARNLGLHAKDFEFTAGTTDLDSFDVTQSNFKVVEYMIWIKSGTKIQAGKVLIMQDGGTPHIQEFAIMYEPSRIANLTAVKVGNDVKLRATMESGISGTIKCKWSRSSLL